MILDESRRFCGYECKYFDTHYELAVALDATSRSEIFPRWTFRHSVNLAHNLAILFDRVHAHEIVIGDVNPANILFNDHTVVSFVDLDSAQVRTVDGTVFPCQRSTPFTAAPEVLKALHSNDELQRTVHQDAFGLAILVHELLLGWHPFAGTYCPASSESKIFPPNIEQRIAANLSSYANLFAADSRKTSAVDITA